MTGQDLQEQGVKNIAKWLAWVLALWLACAVATLGVEQNYRYGAWLDGQGLGAHQIELLGVSLTLGAGTTLAVLNALKVILPIMVKEFGSRFLKSVASLIFVCLAVQSIWNTFSLTTLTRADRVAMETQQLQRVADLRADHSSQFARLKALGETRPAAQVEADLAAERQSKSWSSSKACADATSGDSRLFCTTYNRIKAELAAATEAGSIRAKMETLRAAIAKANHPGAINPELAMVQRLTGFDSEAAGGVRALAFAVIFELAEAFALVLAWACCPATATDQTNPHFRRAGGSHDESSLDSCQTLAAANDDGVKILSSRSLREGSRTGIDVGQAAAVKPPPVQPLEGYTATLREGHGGQLTMASLKPQFRSPAQPAAEKPAGTFRVVGSNVASYAEARLTTTVGAAVQAADLWADYQGWCVRNGQEPVTQTRFGRELPCLGIAKAKTGGCMWYQDVALSA
jgi:hypothetical protein